MAELTDSGFPFQLGIKRLANQSPSWQVALTEHPWRDSLQETDRFIDLVIRDRQAFVNLVVECKRSRETEWMFLRETVSAEFTNNRVNVRARVIGRHRNGHVTSEWMNTEFVPGSPEANFCVVRKNKGKSDDLIERPAAEIVRATEALAHQEHVLHSKDEQYIRRIYIPVIVSNAKMFICDGEWDKLNVESGEVAFSNIQPVDFVRFRKSFSASLPQAAVAKDASAFAELSERTVVVVQAGALLDFLRKWGLPLGQAEFLNSILG
jgi:hypothetical protein